MINNANFFWKRKFNRLKEVQLSVNNGSQLTKMKTRPVNRSEHSHMLHLHFVKFDLWPLNYKWDKELIDIFYVFPRTKHWNCYFASWACLKFDLSLTFDLLTVGRTKRSPWTILDVCLWSTCWHCYFCYLKLFVIWPFFDLWPLIWPLVRQRGHRILFWCLSNANTLTPVPLSFDIDMSCDINGVINQYLWPSLVKISQVTSKI